ncbi:hypothetical protein BKA65DRAFT_511056 [Rhexocercosporidium sp. MPI-PUGE-AT-0058]|nr:hypothetical protein BKA65DRAFT_511056 [Rhexocercosporidium sp. MPI-PUGE-AT-0058]
MALLESVFNHLVLPPKLPGHRDIDLEGIQNNILARLIHACDTLRKFADPVSGDTWIAVQHSLRICLDLNSSGRLDKALVLQELKNLQGNGLLILHAVEQNAALLVRRRTLDDRETIVVEVFEASPSSEDVLAAENCLQWDFPGRAVELPLAEFLKESFQESLATFLEQASMEPLKRFEARSRKAKVSIVEARDTTDPALITQMLMSLLEAVGSSVDVTRIRKRVRDDVNIHNAELPWRRLPFWLVLRIATQRQLCLVLGNESGRAYYKFFICVVLAQLLEDSAGHLAPELTLMLRAKLCRRLAKLEMDKARTPSASAIYSHFFNSVGPMAKEIIEKATFQVESAWAHFKTTFERSIAPLPSHANEKDLQISLPSSGAYLRTLLALPLAHRPDLASLQIPPSGDGTMEQVTKFTDRYFSLAQLEESIENESLLSLGPGVDLGARCVQLADSIINVFAIVGDAYNSNPEQISIMILTVFDLWVQMDKCIISICPLLADYAPVFSPVLLDVLHLPKFSSMQRLQGIQSHLQSRVKDCRFAHKTIFSDIDEDCFAARCVGQSARLCKLQRRVEEGSDKSRRNKELEWKKACREYDELSQEISSRICVCKKNPDGSRDIRGCKKCWHWRCRKKMKIAIHEDFLPTNKAQKAAVILELGISNYIAAYRNTTFRIFNDLAHPSRPKNSPPTMLLKDYSKLQPYAVSTMDGVSLASTKKSFLQTHFKALKMKVDLSDVLLPQGLDFAYYDSTSGVWLKDLDRPLTFQHLCGTHVPQSLLTSIVESSIHPRPNLNGPSSYEIVASQTKCPADISIHEFMAYQRLRSGSTRRWLTMLVELGASNINFSTEDTMLIFNHLAVQAGPAQNDANDLRDAHVVFRDPSFCQRLTEQIDGRLRNIRTNWREMHCMEMLITLSLRLFDLGLGHHRQAAELLLKTARESTLQWISHLRDEVRTALEADAAERAARYGFWAALLCRRTFTIFTSLSEMNAENLSSFVQASVALQENLVVDLAKLPLNLKNMMVRDAKMAYRLRRLIQKSIKSNYDSLGAAINKIWSDPSNSLGRTYSRWQFLSSPNHRWVMSVITSTANKFTVPQVVHYNFIEGHLLVDGKPLGKLPLDIRASEDVKELFGNQHLLTFPSSLSGMSHVMATRVLSNEVHFGLRGKKVVIRALIGDNLLEYVPRRLFMDGDKFDLPSGLIENCVHWLNIRTKRLEIRRKPVIWRARKSDWVLDISNHRVYRNRVALVDPHSALCMRVANIFRHFEDPQRLTVFQPAMGRLSVEMRHLELSFFVNKNKLLECRELHAEIDPNQDAGTLYGLLSKIVLRNVANPEQRSIITPLGNLSYKRHGMHVAVRASSTTEYGTFGIDNVLGRLSCPPEPRLLYSKAQFHAFTSFVLPDPLTGRTGTEEALHTLRSGYCQPWTPISDGLASILKVIGSLSMAREYYPKDKKRLQTTTWDQHLTMSIQHDRYEGLVLDILAKSNRLRAFSGEGEVVDLDIQVPSHLRKRGQLQRSLYERGNAGPLGQSARKDMVYSPRDRHISLLQATNVYQTVALVRNQPFHAYTKKKLAAILQDWKFIGGFCQSNSHSEKHSSCLLDLMENDIGENWGSLVNLCRNTPKGSYELIFRLCLLSFGTKTDMNVIRWLAAFAGLDELRALQPPVCPFFTGLKAFEPPSPELLLQLIATDYPVIGKGMKKNKKQQCLIQEEHRNLCEAEGRRLVSFLLEQWPSSEPSAESFESTVLNSKLAVERILPEWQRLHWNLRLSEYVVQAQKIMDRHKGANDKQIPQAWNMQPVPFYCPDRGSIIPSISDLLVKPAAFPLHHLSFGALLSDDLSRGVCFPSKQHSVSPKPTWSKETAELSNILDSFTGSLDVLRQQYGNDLKKSLLALNNVSDKPQLQEMPPAIDSVREEIENVRAALNHQFEQIKNALSAEDDRFQWLKLGGLWPSTTPTTVLEQLRSSSDHYFGSEMKEALVSYGILATTLQRLLRIRHAQLRGDYHKLSQEWRNAGHENWRPLEFPDWLLLEIESDLLIRCEQVDVANAIISPASGSNSVLQMNMGQGKTSCIVPMAVAVLADRKQLSRLIVPKALLLQTAQTVQSRLGGLVGREIRHIQFSRRTLTTPNMLRLYAAHHHEILQCCGVILTTPEHILSYKLSGLQRLADSKFDEAREMVKFQSWLTDTCRDVLDESDFSLAVKTQLIYPSGPQITVDGHPHRWGAAQILLSLVEDHLPDLQRDFPQSIEVVKRQGGFPMIHLLRRDVEDALLHRIIEDICDGRISFLRVANSTASRHDIKRVLSQENLDFELMDHVLGLFSDKTSARKTILLIRGLLLNRILLLCLKKRWNVQYGLHPNRQPIAVPFDAKGVPSEQAEFGHPDVSILFTCLAFYYAGLSISQFREGLQHVLKSDDPAAEYDRWTCVSDTLPQALHHWNVINGDDQGQVEELWRHLRLNRSVLDHYMNNFVFPAHAKQFGTKLQASGWDLPLFSKSGLGDGISCARTTGFSGTNDNKMMLPLNIKQDDLPSLCQTNAEVLTYILQSRNRRYKRAAWQGKRLTEVELLREMAGMEVRILIDAGAYILEMNNRNLVRAWLDIDTGAKAAVYFGADNRAWVQYRGGKEVVPLLATPFAENLDECLVYIDEAHTRGIDLKLPQRARGAITLALGQTKDHTMQAAMRLRQLGTSQSIVFLAPPEVHQSILDVYKKRHGEQVDSPRIDSSHVLCWLLEQTCRANEHLQHLYLAQGTDFCRRTDAQWRYMNFLTKKRHREAYLKIIQHPERQTLEQLYGEVTDIQPSSLTDTPSTELRGFIEELEKQGRAANGNEGRIPSSALEEVEQEREVEFQVEQIRQVQKPTHYKALEFSSLHPAVFLFATTGTLAGGKGYEHAYDALARTSIGRKYKVQRSKSQLYVSAEFMRTIELGNRISNDDFLRPVEWILWNPSNNTALIVISEEAEILIPVIRAAIKPVVHLIAYAAPVTKHMLHFNRLSYYVLPCLPVGYKAPDWLPIELGIFAGRLYIDFPDCSSLTKYLQLEDRFGTKCPQERSKDMRVFSNNPVDFLQEWLTVRRKGQDIMHTPVGYICQGRPLHESHPFFGARSTDDREITSPSGGKFSGDIDIADDQASDLDDELDFVDAS